MKVLLALILTLSLHVFAQAQVYKRCAKESSKEFAGRIIPRQAKLQYVTETADWANEEKTLMFFYSMPAPENLGQPGITKNILVGSVLTPIRKGKYQQTIIDTLTNYLNPKIEEVFFCNADPDQEKELAVLFSFEMDQQISKCSGKGYDAFFFKKPELNKPGKKLIRITNLTNFYGCDCLCMRNHQESAQFKTQEAILQELKRLGY